MRYTWINEDKNWDKEKAGTKKGRSRLWTHFHLGKAAAREVVHWSCGCTEVFKTSAKKVTCSWEQQGQSGQRQGWKRWAEPTAANKGLSTRPGKASDEPMGTEPIQGVQTGAEGQKQGYNVHPEGLFQETSCLQPRPGICNSLHKRLSAVWEASWGICDLICIVPQLFCQVRTLPQVTCPTGLFAASSVYTDLVNLRLFRGSEHPQKSHLRVLEKDGFPYEFFSGQNYKDNIFWKQALRSSALLHLGFLMAPLEVDHINRKSSQQNV